MHQEQEQHLAQVIKSASELIDMKYRVGVAKYQSNLQDYSRQQLCDEAIMEAVDQLVYLITLRGKL